MLLPLSFAAAWDSLVERHRHPVLRQHAIEATMGQRMAELIARRVATWRFIVAEGTFWLLWFSLNTLRAFPHWDPEPYNLANLIISTQAAITALILLQSTSRHEDKDRVLAEWDHVLSLKHDELLHALTESIGKNTKLTEEMHHLEEENTRLTRELHVLMEALNGPSN